MGVALLFRQRASPLDPLPGIGDGTIQRFPAGPEPKGGHHQAGKTEYHLRLQQALAFLLSQQLLRRD